MSKYENLTGTQLEGFPDEDPIQSLNNTVIEVLTLEHGAKVIEWWKKQGINTSDHEGNCCKEYGYGCRYYGVIKGKFGNYSSKAVYTHNAKIITLPEEMESLPEEKSFPRWMWCWDYDIETAVKRLVIYYNEQLLRKYITLSETEAKRYLDGRLNCTFISYLYAKEIEESENKMDAAIEEKYTCETLYNLYECDKHGIYAVKIDFNDKTCPTCKSTNKMLSSDEINNFLNINLNTL